MNKFTPPPGPKSPPKSRRYDWWAAKNSLPTHPRWRVIAHRTGLPVGTVVAIVVYLNTEANKAHRRGSVEDFRVLECALSLQYDEADVQAVFDALKSTGWIDQEFIVDWFQHNPDQHDPTANERKRRQRDREREEREGRDMSRVTNRDQSRNVTRDKERRHTTSRVTAVTEDVTRDVTLQYNTNTNSKTESVSLADLPLPPVDIVDKSDNFPKPSNDNPSKRNGSSRADELASPVEGGLARRVEDGETDQAAWSGIKIEPLLPSPFGKVTRLLDREGILDEAPRKPKATWPEFLPPGWDDGWKQ